MTDTIKHQGIVENIEGSHVRVRIVQTSACAACSAKGHCSSADQKEKMIDITTPDASSYHHGEHVWVVGTLSMSATAIGFAFVIPFFVVVVALFVLVAALGSELYAALGALALLAVYYLLLKLNKDKLGRKFSFMIQPMTNRNL